MSKYLVSRRSMRHRQGTKEYHLLCIENNETNTALVVFRWGKVGAWGQMQVYSGPRGKIQDMFLDKTTEKQKNGYHEIANKSLHISTVEELKRVVTMPYWSKLGADHLRTAVPEADTTGIKDPEDAEYEDDGSGFFRKKHKIKEHPAFVETPESIAAAAKEKEERERAEAAAKQAQDPLWGLF